MFLDFYQPGWLDGGKKGLFLSSPKSLVKMKLYKTNASGKFIKYSVKRSIQPLQLCSTITLGEGEWGLM